MNKRTRIILVCLLAILALASLSGCNKIFGNNTLDPNAIAVTNINLVESEIFLCPPNDSIPAYRPNYSTYDLQISIWPENATNKNVTTTLEDTDDSKYLSISKEGGRLSSKLAKGSYNNEGNFVAEPIIVIIRSVSNPKVTKRVEVYVEETAITGFKFVPSSKNFIIGDAPWQLIPEFIPRHAVKGIDNIRFASLNEEFATVNSIDGIITPSDVNVGNATIEVTTIAEGAEIQASFDVSVKYEPPNWILDVSYPAGENKNDLFSQIVGYTEPIDFFITTTQTRADNHPKITWRVDGTRKPDEEEQTFTFVPDDMMRGTHRIKVEIADANSQIQTIESPYIEVYEPLESDKISLDVNYAEPTYARDRVSLAAIIETDYYPPISIDWYLYNIDNQEREPYLGGSSPANNYAFSFNIPKAGTFKILADCTVRLNSTLGIHSITKLSDENLSVTALQDGNDIQNIAVTGINHGTPSSPNYLPFVSWDTANTNTEITVEVTKAGETPVRMSSTDNEYIDYFYYNGFAIPTEIAKLTDTFSVRVKGETYGFSEEVEYQAGTIAPTEYKFLNVLDATLNITSYFPDLKQLGKIINYMHMFRPSQFEVPPSGSESRTGYKVNLFTPLQYDDLDNTRYPAGYPSDYGQRTYTDEQINVYRLISAANNAYGESGKYSFNYSVREDDGSFDVTFYFNGLGTTVHNTVQTRQEYPAIPHYTGNPRDNSFDSFAIESKAASISVSTSNQLYLAVSWGLKPLPTAGSPAEEIYNQAKAVLRRIIDNSMSEADKVHAIYDYLSCEVLYDKQLLNMSGQPETQRPADFYNYEGFYMEGVFLRGSAVCDGIAKSFVLLTYMEGIQSVKVSGHSREVGHAWNYVLVNGKWYGVDATWASVYHKDENNNDREISSHRYLLITEQELAESDHNPYGEYAPTEEEGLGYDVYYDKLVGNTPDFDHYIDNATEFEALYAYYANLVANDTEMTELYIELTFHFEITSGNVQQFFSSVNVGLGVSLRWLILGDLQVVYIIIE